MGKLTLGQERTIDESTQSWRMLVYPIMESISSVPDGFKKKIDELDEAYVAGFGEYYTKSIEAEDGRDADEVMSDFDKIWSQDHPEFYDMKLLFAECGDEALEIVERAMKLYEL